VRDLHDPPPVLWALGDLAPARGAVDRAAPSPDAPLRVAIVGTRRPSPYGARVAGELARTLAHAGAVVVSGMAAGIDAAAHVAALDAGAPSIAVLGTGVDVAYPARHRPLHRRLVAKGLVLSEFPPGAAATAGAFPRRNRLLAALCPLTIVVEAGARSGALITAGHALDLGRAVAAVPGHIDAPEAAGSNALLRDGAHVLTDVGALLELIGVGGGAGDPVARLAHRAATAPVLDGDERVVWEALAVDAPDADALTGRAALPASRCLAALGILELSGLVICDAAGAIRRNR